MSSPNAGPHVPRVELDASVEPARDVERLPTLALVPTAAAGAAPLSPLLLSEPVLLIIESDPLLLESDPLLLESDPLLLGSDPLLLESDPLLLESDPLADRELLPSELFLGSFLAIARAVMPAPLAAPIAAALAGSMPSFDSIC